MIDEVCQIECIHSEKISEVKKKMPDDETLFAVSELFKVFGDSTRTKIISALFINELCVCDLANLLNMTKSAVSLQLRVLRQTKIVKSRRSGKEVYYSLDDSHVYKIYEMAVDHLEE